MTLAINDVAPDFEAQTTEGKIRFHDWIGKSLSRLAKASFPLSRCSRNQGRDTMHYVHRQARPGLAQISLFGIATALILAGIATWASSGHSTAQAAIAPPQIDAFSLMANAKNLPSQESLNLKMWPDNGVTHY